MGLCRTRYWFLLKYRYVCVYLLLTSNKTYLRTVPWFMSYRAFILPYYKVEKLKIKIEVKLSFLILPCCIRWTTSEIAFLYVEWNSAQLIWFSFILATYKSLVSVTILLFLYPSISFLHILCMCPKFYVLINFFRWIGN